MKKRHSILEPDASTAGAALAVVIAACLAVSCRSEDAKDGEDTDDTADTDDTDVSDGGCETTLSGSNDPIFDQTNSVIAFTFDTTWDEPFVELSGTILDGPAVSFHEEAAREGQCRLLTYEASSCDPACGGGEVCIDEECVAYPESLSAGTIELSGVLAEPVFLEPEVNGFYYWSPFGENVGEVDHVRIEAAGADVPGFALDACQVGSPEAKSDWSAALETREGGQDVTLEWVDPVDTARVYLRMTTGIGTHGGVSPVEIECEGPDEGALTLPGDFLDALYTPGYWSCGECGDNKLLRYHAVETQAGANTVQLRTQAPSFFWFRP